MPSEAALARRAARERFRLALRRRAAQKGLQPDTPLHRRFCDGACRAVGIKPKE